MSGRRGLSGGADQVAEVLGQLRLAERVDVVAEAPDGARVAVNRLGCTPLNFRSSRWLSYFREKAGGKPYVMLVYPPELLQNRSLHHEGSHMQDKSAASAGVTLRGAASFNPSVKIARWDAPQAALLLPLR